MRRIRLADMASIRILTVNIHMACTIRTFHNNSTLNCKFEKVDHRDCVLRLADGRIQLVLITCSTNVWLPCTSSLFERIPGQHPQKRPVQPETARALSVRSLSDWNTSWTSAPR